MLVVEVLAVLGPSDLQWSTWSVRSSFIICDLHRQSFLFLQGVRVRMDRVGCCRALSMVGPSKDIPAPEP